jgi:hypothetical protein
MKYVEWTFKYVHLFGVVQPLSCAFPIQFLFIEGFWQLRFKFIKKTCAQKWERLFCST